MHNHRVVPLFFFNVFLCGSSVSCGICTSRHVLEQSGTLPKLNIDAASPILNIYEATNLQNPGFVLYLHQAQKMTRTWSEQDNSAIELPKSTLLVPDCRSFSSIILAF